MQKKLNPLQVEPFVKQRGTNITYNQLWKMVLNFLKEFHIATLKLLIFINL